MPNQTKCHDFHTECSIKSTNSFYNGLQAAIYLLPSDSDGWWSQAKLANLV